MASETQILCPYCGAANVRLRRRRWYDYLFTWVRFVLDSIGSPSTEATSSNARGITTRDAQDMLAAKQYREYRDFYEARIGTRTAAYFWKCRSCGQKGELLSDAELHDEDARARVELTAREQDIEARMGTAGRPASGGPNT